MNKTANNPQTFTDTRMLRGEPARHRETVIGFSPERAVGEMGASRNHASMILSTGEDPKR